MPLCTDEWCNVLSFLTSAHLFSQCTHVCKEWNNLIRERVPIHLYFKSFPSWISFLRYEGLNLANVVSLELRTGSYNEEYCHGYVYDMIKLMPNLKHLYIGDATAHGDSDILFPDLSGLNKLQSLVVHDSLVNQAFIKRIPSSITRLKIGSATGCEFHLAWLEDFPMLEEIHIGCATVFKREDVVNKPLNHLTRLEFVKCVMGDLWPDEKLMKNLSRLRLHNSRFSNRSIIHISKLIGLTHLDLSSSFSTERNSIGDEGFKYISSLSNLSYLNLRGNSVSAKGAEHLASLKNLTHLNLANNGSGIDGIGSDGAKHLSALLKLVHLDIESNIIGKDGAEHLSSLVNLTRLNLNGNGIGDDGAEHLSSLKELTHLDAQTNVIRKKGAKVISQLTKLVHLDLSNNPTGDGGAEYLSQLPSLIHLNLKNNSIENEGIRYLSRLSSLTYLNLDTNSFIDDGVKNLSRLSNLTYLDLSSNLVTDCGVVYISKLKKLLYLILNPTITTRSMIDHLHYSIPNLCVKYAIEKWRSSLQVDEWNRIFSFLNTRDLLYGCVPVSKLWKRLVERKILTIRINNPSDWIRFIENGSREVDIVSLKIYIIESEMHDKNPRLYKKKFYEKIERMINLEHLSIAFKSDDWDEECRLPDLSNLRKLVHLSVYGVPLGDKVFDRIPGSVKRLDISTRSYRFITRHSNIEDLTSEFLSRSTGSDKVSDSYIRYGIERRGSTGGLWSCEKVTVLKNLTHLDLKSSFTTEHDLVRFHELTSLVQLSLTRNCINEKGAEHLSRLTRLVSLDLSDNQIKDDGAAHISGLVNLKRLILPRNGITESGAKCISQLTELTRLDLSENSIADGGVDHISTSRTLTHLLLAGNGITEHGAGYLARLNGLITLDLSENPVGDIGAKHVSVLINLTRLCLRNSSITDNGLEYLSRLSKLVHLNLLRNGVTYDGTRQLSIIPNLDWTLIPNSSDNYSDEEIVY